MKFVCCPQCGAKRPEPKAPDTWDCPACGETVYFDEADIDNGFAACPACGEKLEFDLDDECGCGCDGCGDDADDKDE